jgi:flagellar biosynthesis/type III secretory pathway M-ring protein FliF/YscJ
MSDDNNNEEEEEMGGAPAPVPANVPNPVKGGKSKKSKKNNKTKKQRKSKMSGGDAQPLTSETEMSPAKVM